MTVSTYVLAAALVAMAGPFLGKAIRTIARNNGGR